MVVGRTIFVGIYILFGAFLLYRLLFKKDPIREEYERLYSEIIHSDKYKVKGQYDKRD